VLDIRPRNGALIEICMLPAVTSDGVLVSESTCTLSPVMSGLDSLLRSKVASSDFASKPASLSMSSRGPVEGGMVEGRFSGGEVRSRDDWLPNSFCDIKMDFGSEFMKLKQICVQNATFPASGRDLEQFQRQWLLGPGRLRCQDKVRNAIASLREASDGRKWQHPWARPCAMD
jgi:hypothetical protein